MKMVAFLSLCRVNQFVLWGKQTRRRGRQKKLEQSRARRQSTDQKRARTLSLSLCVCVVVFKADLSLFNLSPFVSCGGKQRSVDTLNKEEAKKLEHKSRGVKKHEHRNCSESALFSLCLFSPCFFVQTLRLFHQCPWRSPQSLNKGPLFPTINIKHLNTYD